MARMTPTPLRLASPQLPVLLRRRSWALAALVVPLVVVASLIASGPRASASMDEVTSSPPQGTTAPGEGTASPDEATSSGGSSTSPSAGYGGGVDGPHQDTDKEQTGQDVSTTEVVLIGLIILAALSLVVTLVVRRRRQIRG